MAGLGSSIERSETQAANITPARQLRRGWLILGMAAAPVLLAIWYAQAFSTQDGPAHLYNAQILAAVLGGSSPLAETFEVHWDPIPNWTGHATLALLVSVFPAWFADRVMTTVTFAGFAASVFWLRTRTAGARGLPFTAVASVLLAINFTWIMGFTSFVLGACLFPITLGYWWTYRDALSPLRIAILALLLVAGYFCHLVSLGITLFGLGILALFAPASSGEPASARMRFSRLIRTGVAMPPVLALGIVYLRISRSGGAMHPEWEHLKTPWSPTGWAERLSAIDPITIAIKDGLPFTDHVSKLYALFAPAVWLSIALACWWYGRMHAPKAPGREGWAALAGFLFLLGLILPDSLGAAHGQYLPHRVLLLGLVALVPILDLDTGKAGKAAAGALVFALLVQSALVWDYALYCDQTTSWFIQARSDVGEGQRVATLLVRTRSRFRANPILHADSWVGVDAGNIIWSDYETSHYYFPVQFKKSIKRPLPGDLERISIMEGESEAGDRAEKWRALLEKHVDEIDVLLVWKSDRGLESIAEKWFKPGRARGDLKILFRESD